MFWAGLEEALDIAAGRKVLTLAGDDDDTHAVIFIECLEDEAELIAGSHRDHVVGRPCEDDVRALAGFIELDMEAVELGKARIGEGHCLGHRSIFHLGVFLCTYAVVVSAGSTSYSPATSRRRRSFPTGDFGISRTKT